MEDEETSLLGSGGYFQYVKLIRTESDISEIFVDGNVLREPKYEKVSMIYDFNTPLDTYIMIGEDYYLFSKI